MKRLKNEKLNSDMYWETLARLNKLDRYKKKVEEE